MGLLFLITPALLITGALVDKRNRWRGAFLGYAGGALVTTTIASVLVANELARQQLEGETDDGSDLLQGS